MKDYLTIGEVSQIKRISTKSLRYYERIGILVPAVINPDNGYRYYTSDQLLTIDMIKFLAAMDFPLKEWNKYLKPNQGFYLKELIEDSKALAIDQIHQLQKRLNRLERAGRGIKNTEKYSAYEGFYERVIPARNILYCSIDHPQSPVEFHKSLSILFEAAEQNGLSANYPSGMLMDYTPENRNFSVFLEIYEKLDEPADLSTKSSENLKVIPKFRHFPDHKYCCIRKEQKSILNIIPEMPEYFTTHPCGTIIEADCITSPVDFRPYPTELQFY